MTISDRSTSIQAAPIGEARVAHVDMTEEAVIAQLTDGRVLGVPLAWFPRLLAATPAQRAVVELIGDGSGIHWPEIDEDLEVAELLGREGQRVGQGNDNDDVMIRDPEGVLRGAMDAGPVAGKVGITDKPYVSSDTFFQEDQRR